MWKWEAEEQPKAVVAIVHSAYEHSQRFAWLIQKLRSRNFHVVMGDLPGHGEQSSSKVHDETFTTYIDYVEKLLDVAITERLPLFIFGHGLGATLVMYVLQKKKIECAGVVLSSPWLHLQHNPPKYATVLTKLSSSMKVDHELTIEKLTRNYDIYIEAREDEYYNTVVTASWYKELQTLMKLVSLNEKKIQDIPVLLHTAERDQVVKIDETKKWLMNQGLSEFHYKEWKSLYHDVYQEPERDEVYQYTESFMHTTLRSLGYIV